MGILKAKAGQAATVSHPQFEGEDGMAVGTTTTTEEIKTVTREQVKQTAPVVEQQAADQVEGQSATVSGTQTEQPAESQDGAAAPTQTEAPKSTAVLARAAGGQLKTFLNSGGGMVSPLVDLKDAFQKAGIDIDYSTFPRLRVDAGCIASAEGAEAGEWIEIQIVSYSPSWTITPGVDGKEGKEHVRFSDDGKVTNAAGDNDEFAGSELETYRQHLISLGFEKAAIKEYEVIYGLALDCDEADFAHKNEMVALSLAPESRKKFDSYKINRSIQAKMGRVVETSGNPVVKFTSVRVSGKERSYFNLIPSHGVTAPIDLS